MEKSTKNGQHWFIYRRQTTTHYPRMTRKILESLIQTFAVITHPDQTDTFIRCTLTQKVIDHCEDLEYELWVSLSAKSFQDYSDNFNNENHETKYFGWLSNDLPDYDFSEGGIPRQFYKGGK